MNNTMRWAMIFSYVFVIVVVFGVWATVSLVKQKKVHMLCKHLVLMPSSIWNAGVELSPFDKPNDGRRCPTSCRIGYDLRLSIDHSRYSRIRRSKVYSDGPPIQSNLVFGCRG